MSRRNNTGNNGPEHGQGQDQGGAGAPGAGAAGLGTAGAGAPINPQLVAILDRLTQARLEPRRRPFKPPQYNGDGDIELFINQFNQVVMTNQWTEEEAFLHLRLSLIGPALDCSRGADRGLSLIHI